MFILTLRAPPPLVGSYSAGAAAGAAAEDAAGVAAGAAAGAADGATAGAAARVAAGADAEAAAGAAGLYHSCVRHAPKDVFRHGRKKTATFQSKVACKFSPRLL